MGGCDPSCSESHPCGVLGCPSFPFTYPPAAMERETGSLQPSRSPGALEETSPLITAADESHPLQQPPSAPVLPDEAISSPPPPPPPPLMAAPMPYQEKAIPPCQFVGASSSAPPPPPPQGLNNYEVPIQKVESVDYPPPGHRPFGGEDLGRRSTRRAFPGPHGRNYEYIPLMSDLGRQRCRQYYPNDHYLNNRPWYRRVESWLGRDPAGGSCVVPPRSRRVRDRVPSYCPNVEDSNYVPPLRRWNSYPAREIPSSSARQNHDEDVQGGASDGRQPAAGEGTLVQDNIVIGDPTRVRIGEGNRGGRSTGGRVTGNVVIR